MSSHGVILAGGRSTRMGGGEKALLPVAGRPLIARVVARLSQQLSHIAISANNEIDAYAAHARPVLRDALPDHPGPLAGILAAMRWGEEAGASHVITVAGDTPFFPAGLAADLAAAGGPIAMAATPDPERGTLRHPVFARWEVALADNLEAALQRGTRKIVAWADTIGVTDVAYPVTPFDPFFNINTPEDLAEAEAMIRDHGL